MFGFYLSFLWVLLILVSREFTFPTGLIPPIQFLFWWNLIFSSFWLVLVLIVVFGLLGFLLKVPVLGILLQGIRNQVKEIGWVQFLANRTTVWLLSQSLILTGSYLFAYQNLNESWMYTASLMTIILGYYIKQNFYKPMTNLSGSRNVFIFRGNSPSGFPENRENFPKEKDVTPP